MRPRARVTLVGASAVAVAGLVWQVHTPARVRWEPAILPGCAAWKADGLVLQEEDGGTVWASQGYDVYRSQNGEAFERVASLRPPLGEAWGGYLRTLRKAYGYEELLEVLPLQADVLLVFGGGGVYRIDLANDTQTLVHTLRYFGRGRGRGVMSHIAVDDHGDVFYGEYSTVLESHTIRIWRGTDEGQTWTTAYELPAGEALHAHGVQWDPVAHLLWAMTGDTDAQSRIGFSADHGEHFEWIAQGQQLDRACSLIFTPDAVLWATDTEDNHLVRWSRSTRDVSVLADMPGQSLYAEPLDHRRSLVGQSACARAVSARSARRTPDPRRTFGARHA
jgi:hypothetical protein